MMARDTISIRLGPSATPAPSPSTSGSSACRGLRLRCSWSPGIVVVVGDRNVGGSRQVCGCHVAPRLSWATRHRSDGKVEWKFYQM
jgi:hypothetical protein